MQQVKVFAHFHTEKTEKKANEWLKKNDGKVKIDQIIPTLSRSEFVITVIYSKKTQKRTPKK